MWIDIENLSTSRANFVLRFCPDCGSTLLWYDKTNFYEDKLYYFQNPEHENWIDRNSRNCDKLEKLDKFWISIEREIIFFGGISLLGCIWIGFPGNLACCFLDQQITCYALVSLQIGCRCVWMFTKIFYSCFNWNVLLRFIQILQFNGLNLYFYYIPLWLNYFQHIRLEWTCSSF